MSLKDIFREISDFSVEPKKIQWIRNIFLGSPEKTEISLNISFRDILQVTKNTSSYVNAICILVCGKSLHAAEQ